MDGINSILEKIKDSLFSREKKKVLIANTINAVAGTSLSGGEISVVGNILKIKSSPIVKNQILIKKAEILVKVKEKIGFVEDIA